MAFAHRPPRCLSPWLFSRGQRVKLPTAHISRRLLLRDPPLGVTQRSRNPSISGNERGAVASICASTAPKSHGPLTEGNEDPCPGDPWTSNLSETCLVRSSTESQRILAAPRPPTTRNAMASQAGSSLQYGRLFMFGLFGQVIVGLGNVPKHA